MKQRNPIRNDQAQKQSQLKDKKEGLNMAAPTDNKNRQISTGQQNSSNADNTLARGGGNQHYEFDSCISTEEAFFNGEENKMAAFRNINRISGSNPQEDSTPKASFNRTNRRTVETFTDESRPKTGFNPNRQRTQRWSPKGRNMAKVDKGPNEISRGSNKVHDSLNQKGVRNSSQGLLANLNDESNDSKKLTPNSKPKISTVDKKFKLVTKQKSNSQIKGFQSEAPLLKQQSMNASGLLERDSSFFDLVNDQASPQKQSQKSIVNPSSDGTDQNNNNKAANKKNKNGSFFPNGNQSRKQLQSSSSKENSVTAEHAAVADQYIPAPIGRTESARQLNAPVVSSGQGDMRLDMKFGWRPQFNERDLHRKEAIAIKLKYPNHQSLNRQSVRVSLLASELYRMNKNFRVLKKEFKQNYVADFPSKLVYQGYRPTVSLELHLRYGQKANFIEDSQYYDVLIPKNVKAKALESGMNRLTPRSPVDESTLKTYENPTENPSCELIFDSMFESGNLDLAIQVQPREFNLYLKPDTNTKGYCNWFFFKVKRKPDHKGRFPARKYQFNIMNMYKKKILYRQEAKPLACFSEIHHKGFMMQELECVSWKTACFANIGYGLVNTSNFTQADDDQDSDDDFQLGAIKKRNVIQGEANLGVGKQKFYCLTFDFDFPSGNEFAYIASSIPYPYTFLQKTIKTCTRLDQAMTTLTRSLGGLQIPMLTITNNVINVSKKRTVIICGRIHPGETNSSWVLHGMIDYLISKDASHLRDNLIFKIVPMVNPDGVVAGNYRTSFIGKDLNRLYLQSEDTTEARYGSMDDILKPEITAMKQLIKGCKDDESKGILAFVDVHHHSQKRGAFMFGPSYQMHNSKYQEVRVLPKLISMMLPQMFRFQSCKFKNQSYKENCARLFCDREVGITYSFCLECSQQGYFAQDQEITSRGAATGAKYRRVKYFDQNSLMYLGRKICEAIYILNEMSDTQDQKRDAIQKRRKLRMKKKKQGFGNKSTAGKSNFRNSKAGDQSSMQGATDFDLESEYRNNSSNMSVTSQDFLQGGINPKMGLKTFIAQMMQKKNTGVVQPEQPDDSKRGALRNKSNARKFTHFGSEDAVSEKSEKDEESLSGSDGGSSGQDLSEQDQDDVLNQVLDQLMPNRIRKINPVKAQITIKQNAQPELQKPPTKRNLKSAARVITVDKRMIQKEQLMIPKAILDLQVQNQTGNNTMLGRTQEQMPSGIVANFDDDQGRIPIAAVIQQTRAKPAQNTFKVLTKNPVTTQKSQLNNLVQGVYQIGPNQGYVNQRQQKKRIQSSRYAVKPTTGGDLFANPRNVQLPQTRHKQVNSSQRTQQSNNMFQMANSTAAQQSYFNSNPLLNQELQPGETVRHQIEITKQIINRQSLRTAGNQQHSQSQTWNDPMLPTDISSHGLGASATRPSQTRMHQRHGSSSAIDSGIDSGGGTAQSYLASRNDIRVMRQQITQGTMEIGDQTVEDNSAKLYQASSSAFDINQWPFARQTQLTQPDQEPQNSFSLASKQQKAGTHKRHQTTQNTPIKASPQVRIQPTSSLRKALAPQIYSNTAEKIKTNILSSADFLPPPTGQNTNFSYTQSQPISPNLRSNKEQRANIPLSQGGFFHRNQIVGGYRELEQRQTEHQVTKPSDVVIRTKSGVGVTSPAAVLSMKRNSAIEAIQKKTTHLNRITHKRSSAQLIMDHQQKQTFLGTQNAARNVQQNNFASATGLFNQSGHTMNQNLGENNQTMYNQYNNAPIQYNEDLDLQQFNPIRKITDNRRVIDSHPVTNMYNSPQKTPISHMRLDSSSTSIRQNKTTRKKTDALLSSDSKKVIQSSPSMYGGHTTQTQAPSSKATPIIQSNRARKIVRPSQNQTKAAQAALLQSNDQRQKLTGVNSNRDGQYNRIGHNRGQIQQLRYATPATKQQLLNEFVAHETQF